MLSPLKVNSRLTSATKIFFLSATILVLAACSQNKNDSSLTAVQDAAQSAKAQAAKKAADEAKAVLAAMSQGDLKNLAETAFREQRLYAPAANNALEYYLALRKKSTQPDPLIESALMDLSPYTVIAAEQAISRMEFDEAIRLRDLIAAIDPGAPSLPRISQAIMEGMSKSSALAASEAKRQQDEILAAELAVQKSNQEILKAAAAVNLEVKPSLVTSVAPTTRPSITAAPAPASVIPSQTLTTSVMPEPAPSSKASLVAIRTPDPDFPSDALNRGLSGDVEIEFVVQKSGEVSDVRVVNSNQRAFDRNVVMTVKRWKFAPLDAPMTVRRSFNFKNPS